jgi:hypothetical protein
MMGCCTLGYKVRDVNVSGGITTAELSGSFIAWAGMALVIAVIVPEARDINNTGLIALYVPQHQKIVFTWASSVCERP